MSLRKKLLDTSEAEVSSDHERYLPFCMGRDKTPQISKDVTLEENAKALEEKDKALEEKERELAEKDRLIAELRGSE